MSQGHNLSGQQFTGPADVWYKSSASGHTTYAYEKGTRKRVGQLQTTPKPWGSEKDISLVHHVEVDESRRGQGIATGMYAKFHARNPYDTVEHREFTMSSHAKRLLPKLQAAFPGKHTFVPRDMKY